MLSRLPGVQACSTFPEDLCPPYAPFLIANAHKALMLVSSCSGEPASCFAAPLCTLALLPLILLCTGPQTSGDSTLGHGQLCQVVGQCSAVCCAAVRALGHYRGLTWASSACGASGRKTPTRPTTEQRPELMLHTHFKTHTSTLSELGNTAIDVCYEYPLRTWCHEC